MLGAPVYLTGAKHLPLTSGETLRGYAQSLP